MKRILRAATLLGAFLIIAKLDAADWPMMGSDATRSGYTTETLSVPLTLQWTYHAAHAPEPAWPKSDRQPFDRCYQPVVAGNLLYFGSSANGKVYALDATSGQERWSFFTGAPVRFAPAVWKDRVFVASDDGVLYCLAAADGKVLWQKRGGPDERMILGNDHIISQWPARGGPVVVDNVVYFAAGIWPSDGIYLYALDAASGNVLWLNNDSGGIYMGQPHGGANANSGVAAQGYLVGASDRLLVPTGRAVPAVFRRADGKFEYFHLQQNGHKGGTSTIAAGSGFLNAGLLFDTTTGANLEGVGAGALVATTDGVLQSGPTAVTRHGFVDKEKKDKKGNTIKYRGLERQWTASVPGGSAAIVAGKTAIVGAPGQVSAVDLVAQKAVWFAPVEGTVYGLAVANSRLYASTDRGKIYCFASKRTENPTVIKKQTPAGASEATGLYAAAAKKIVEAAGVTDGYCVDLGCGDGSLSLELARLTKLKIYAIESDPEKAAAARRRLDAEGLYGVRVTVHQADPKNCPYPKHFADLVVSGRSITAGKDAVALETVQRLQRPYGGVLCVGETADLKKTVRGALPGAGQWTHQYADPANTCCSDDAIVKGALSMLWFRDSDFTMPSRHGRGPAPLFLEGRLFVEGLNGVRAVNAYNGRPLWEHAQPSILKPYHGEHLMGTAGTHSNICVTADGVYLRSGTVCLRLDNATGKKLGEFEAPKRKDGKPGTWGYLACEGGTLYGSLVDEGHIVRWNYGKGDMSQQFTESLRFFALDALTGKLKWTFDAQHAIRHNAIAIGGGRVYLIDRPEAQGDRVGAAKDKANDHPKGELIALDAATGKILWRTSDDIYGTLLTLSVKHGVLVMGYQPTAFRLPSERGGQMTAYRAADGKRLWEQKVAYSCRPVINDKTVYATVGAQGGAWNLLSGEEKRFKLNRSYGCGQLASGTHLMVFRSATLGCFDLQSSSAVEDYGGLRPGCWINAFPAGGVVLVPDASAGCECSYLNQAWVALQARD